MQCLEFLDSTFAAPGASEAETAHSDSLKRRQTTASCVALPLPLPAPATAGAGGKVVRVRSARDIPASFFIEASSCDPTPIHPDASGLIKASAFYATAGPAAAAGPSPAAPAPPAAAAPAVAPSALSPCRKLQQDSKEVVPAQAHISVNATSSSLHEAVPASAPTATAAAAAAITAATFTSSPALFEHPSPAEEAQRPGLACLAPPGEGCSADSIPCGPGSVALAARMRYLRKQLGLRLPGPPPAGAVALAGLQLPSSLAAPGQ